MASIESNYELNIARKTNRTSFYDGKHNPIYEHFCRIELGAGSADEMGERARDISARFPAPMFSVTLTYWQCSGRRMSIDALGVK